MNSLFEKQLNFNKNIKLNFDGGDLRSDAELLLYKEFDKKIGFSDRLSIETIKQFEKINEKLTDIIYSIKMPEHILLDLDSTNYATYGNQYGAKYNSHYSANGFHLLVAFDGLRGDFIKAKLRVGNIYTSRNVVNFIGLILYKYKNKYEKLTRIVRANSGFATPKLYELLEDNNTLYAISYNSAKILE